jgi:hypothetical protein
MRLHDKSCKVIWNKIHQNFVYLAVGARLMIDNNRRLYRGNQAIAPLFIPSNGHMITACSNSDRFVQSTKSYLKQTPDAISKGTTI